MLALLTLSVSLVFLDDARFTSHGIAMLSLFITHLNPSSRENLLLAISDLTCLEMGISESSIDFILMVLGISQRMHGITMERIIPLFAISGIDRDRYPGMKSRCLAGNVALVNCDLLDISGLLSSEETQ